MKYPILEKMFEIENPKSVFEIGCAGGPFLKELREHYGDILVGGMDITRSDLESAKEKFPPHIYGDMRDNFIVHNLVETPWPIEDNKYDIVFCIGVLMYIFEPEKVIRECLRIGKKLILAEFHNGNLDEYGGLTKVTQGEKVVGLGITRNYCELIKKMGLKYEVKSYDPPFKTIISCHE